MPTNDFYCAPERGGCGDDFSGLFYHGMVNPNYPKCPTCDRQFTNDDTTFEHRKGGNIRQAAPFRKYYMETAPPDFEDPATIAAIQRGEKPIGRWIGSEGELKKLERELEEEGSFIRGGNDKAGVPSVRQERREIARQGPAYFRQKEHDQREKGLTEQGSPK